MSTRQRVIDQLGEAVTAHRTAHHQSVAQARHHREQLAAAREQRAHNPDNVIPPDESGLMPGDMPAALADL